MIEVCRADRPQLVTFQRFHLQRLQDDAAPPTGLSSGRGALSTLNGDATLLTEGRPKKEAIRMSAESRHPIYRRRLAASQYLFDRFGFNCAVATLAKFASVGGGPRYVTVGRIPLYPQAELDAWALSRISPLKASTSDTGPIDPSAPSEKTSAGDDDRARSTERALPPSVGGGE